MADTVAVMNQGRIEQMGSPADIYENPRTAFVANFLGQSNLFPGSVVGRESDSVLVSAHGTTFRIPTSRVATSSQASAGPAKVNVESAAAKAVASRVFMIVSSRSLVQSQCPCRARGQLRPPPERWMKIERGHGAFPL